MTRSQANRAALKALVDAGKPPGLIGYRGKVPVGWVSIGAREDYARLRRSPVMKAVDEQPVWSVICFVVWPRTAAREWRRPSSGAPLPTPGDKAPR